MKWLLMSRTKKMSTVGGHPSIAWLLKWLLTTAETLAIVTQVCLCDLMMWDNSTCYPTLALMVLCYLLLNAWFLQMGVNQICIHYSANTFPITSRFWYRVKTMHPMTIKLWIMNLEFFAASKSHNSIIVLTISIGEHLQEIQMTVNLQAFLPCTHNARHGLPRTHNARHGLIIGGQRFFQSAFTYWLYVGTPWEIQAVFTTEYKLWILQKSNYIYRQWIWNSLPHNTHTIS